MSFETLKKKIINKIGISVYNTFELDNILNWIEQLSELDTDGISPVFSSYDEKDTKYRTDEINDGGYRDDIISNAPLSEDGFFLVPKVVD